MQMPVPTPQHEWLQKLVGEWETEIEVYMEPGKPPMKAKGSHRDRMVGGLWLISEGRNHDNPYEFVLTLGYDAKQRKYVGTYIDTMASYIWKYLGAVNSAGNILTLETEGPSPMSPDKVSKFREVTEFKSKDHRVFTSSMLGEAGKWTTMLTVSSRRKA
jgi:hypothetical protein